MPKQTFRDRLADYFRQHPNEWIDGRALEPIAGRYAWRSRCSDCRLQLGMQIENRQRTVKPANGEPFTVSEYRYVPPVSRVIDLATATEQRLF